MNDDLNVPVHDPYRPVDEEEAQFRSLHNPNAAWRRLPPTEKQQAFIRSCKLSPSNLTRGKAADIISRIMKHQNTHRGFIDYLKHRPDWDDAIERYLITGEKESVVE